MGARMKVKFLGAARTVTGSCYLVETGKHRFAIDCGMHQGGGEIEKRNWDTESYDPPAIDFFLVTHAHIDHAGLLPRMVQQGFRGKIYATPPTRDLLEVMLLDSAHVQEMETQWRNKKRTRHGERRIQPLYRQQDVLATLPFFEERSYGVSFSPVPGVRANFCDAGHILGSSTIELWVEENGARSKLVFSGDIGRPAQLLVDDTAPIGTADFLFLESTYGDRNHKNEKDSLNELAEAVAFSYRRKEKVIIPAFAVERSQEVIYSLFLLFKEGKLPADMPVYLDSPLAIRATEIFRRHREYFDDDAKKILANGEDPLSLPQLRFSESSPESMALNSLSGPAVIISASGMADAGRVRHHLRHNLWREGASVVFVGFQAEGTPGRRLVEGAKTIRLLGDEVIVKARIFTINGFSAHAGQSQILDWLSHFKDPQMQIFLVHGEYRAQKILEELIRKRFGLEVCIPEHLEETGLRPGRALERKAYPEKAAPPIDWGVILGEMESRLSRLREQKQRIEAKERGEQTDLKERFQELNRNLDGILEEI
jgi:metallo-beta-lactamase family protein